MSKVLEDWAKRQLGTLIGPKGDKSKAVKFMLGKNKRGAWFKLKNGKTDYKVCRIRGINEQN